MTNMQLAYSEFLENARHNRVAEDTSRMDVIEKQRHNAASEQLTTAQQALDKYLGELNNAAQLKKVATEADINKLKILTDKALREVQNQISWAEWQTANNKVNAEIAKLRAEARKNTVDANTMPEMRQAQNEANQAKAAAYNAKAYGTIEGIIANAGGKEAAKGLNKALDVGTDVAVGIVKPTNPGPVLQRRYAINSTGGTTKGNPYK